MATDPSTITEPSGDPAPISAEDFYNDTKEPRQPANEQDPQEPVVEDPDAVEGEEQEAEPIEAPKSWAKEDREGWDAIPRAQQEIISRRETERDKHLRTVTTQASQTEQRVQNEARQALSQIMDNHARELTQYASLFEVPAPDPRLLSDPQTRDIYFQQEAQYRAAAAHRDNANRQATEARQQYEALQQREQEIAKQEFHRVLSEEIPEWSDPSERANLLTKLEPIAAELGYSAEAQSQANASDILALRRAHDWKAKAEKYDALMKQKMAPVRAAKTLAPNARTPSPSSTGNQQLDDVAILYPNDLPRR